MTNNTLDAAMPNSEILLKLSECDPETLHMLQQDQCTISEIMQDEASMGIVRKIVMNALLEGNQFLADKNQGNFRVGFFAARKRRIQDRATVV